MNSKLSTLALAATLTILACEDKEKKQTPAEAAAEQAGGGTFTDTRDGKTYKTVKVGTLTWLAENLNYAAEGSKCYGEGYRAYDAEKEDYITFSAEEIQANCQKYGRLYFWETAMKACPSGWLLPSDEIWEALVDFAGSDGKLKAKNGWKDIEGKSYNGTDIYGFSALPSGNYNGYNSVFSDIGRESIWWSSTDLNYYQTYAWGFSTYKNDVRSEQHGKQYMGYSVRCVLEDAAYQNTKAEAAKKTAEKYAKGACPNAITSNNTVSCGGQTYKTVKIGKQVWMAENLNYEAKDSSSRCYNDSTSYCGKYGRLYNWETAMTVCPKDWHLPTDAEWQSLVDLAGGSETAGGKLKAKSGWGDEASSNGDDSFGFSALPGGIFFPQCLSCGDDCCYEHTYVGVGYLGYWWTSAKKYAKWEMSSGMNVSKEDGFNPNTGGSGEGDLFSVRCIQN